MFCPFCGRQNEDSTLFCVYCGKAMSQNTPLLEANQRPKKAPKARLSNDAKKAIITGTLIVGFVLIVLLLYYPSIFPWNW